MAVHDVASVVVRGSVTWNRGCIMWSSSSRMRVIYHNWSATKQRPHPQSVAEISHHSVLSGDRIRQCETAGWIELLLGTWLDLIQCLIVVDGVGKAV